MYQYANLPCSIFYPSSAPHTLPIPLSRMPRFHTPNSESLLHTEPQPTVNIYKNSIDLACLKSAVQSKTTDWNELSTPTFSIQSSSFVISLLFINTFVFPLLAFLLTWPPTPSWQVIIWEGFCPSCSFKPQQLFHYEGIEKRRCFSQIKKKKEEKII